MRALIWMRSIRFGRMLPATLGVAAAVLLASACQPGAAAPASHSPGRSGPDLAERATPSGTATSSGGRPAPKAAPRPSLPASAVYVDSLVADAQHLIAANAARVGACGGRDLSGCGSALRQVAAAAAALQRDLDAHPAPACLLTADTTLRSAIDLSQQGAQLGLKGLADGSSAELSQARTLLDVAASRMTAASGQLGQPGCGSLPSAAP